ncbi:unnamed protein product, partial [Candidula unifasciata]
MRLKAQLQVKMHIEGQTTKRYGLPLSHLEYSFRETCTSVKELEKTVATWRCLQGKFPDLKVFAEKRLEALSPESCVLNKERPILRPDDPEKRCKHTNMQGKDANIPAKATAPKDQDDDVE